MDYFCKHCLVEGGDRDVVSPGPHHEESCPRFIILCKYCRVRATSRRSIYSIGDHHGEDCPRNEAFWIDYLRNGSDEMLYDDKLGCLQSAIGERKRLWRAIIQADVELTRKLFDRLMPMQSPGYGSSLGSVCSLLREVIAQQPQHAGHLYIAFKPVLDRSTAYGNAIEDGLSCVAAVCESGPAGVHEIEQCNAVVQLFLAKHGQGANHRGDRCASSILRKYFVSRHIAYYHLNQLGLRDLNLSCGYYSCSLSGLSLPNAAMSLVALARRRGSLWEIDSGDALCLLAKSLSQSTQLVTAEMEAAHVLKEKFIRSLLVLARCRQGRRIPAFIKEFFPTWHVFYGISVPRHVRPRHQLEMKSSC